MNKHIFHKDDIKIGPRMIVFIGERPGQVRKTCHDYFAFKGNKSGDLLHKITSKIKNRGYILMNVIPYHIKGVTNDEARMHDTLIEYKKFSSELYLYMKYFPVTDIVCLGEFSYKMYNKYCVNKLKKISHNIWSFAHPSFIMRFNMDKDIYIYTILRVLS